MKLKSNDKVKSHLSLWKGDIGTVWGIVEVDDGEKDDMIWVIFPETEKHTAYRQLIDSRYLTVVTE